MVEINKCLPLFSAGRPTLVEINKCQKLLEMEKEIVREVARGDVHKLRKSAGCKAQITPVCGMSALLVCALRSADFLSWCSSTQASSRTISLSISNHFWYRFDSCFQLEEGRCSRTFDHCICLRFRLQLPSVLATESVNSLPI